MQFGGWYEPEGNSIAGVHAEHAFTASGNVNIISSLSWDGSSFILFGSRE